MKLLKFTCVVLLSASFFMVGCKKKPKGIDHASVASEVCNCAGDLSNTMKELQSLSAGENAAENLTKIQELTQSVKSQTTEMEGCLTKLGEKYPTFDDNSSEDYKKITELVSQKCADVSDLIQ